MPVHFTLFFLKDCSIYQKSNMPRNFDKLVDFRFIHYKLLFSLSPLLKSRISQQSYCLKLYYFLFLQELGVGVDFFLGFLQLECWEDLPCLCVLMFRKFCNCTCLFQLGSEVLFQSWVVINTAIKGSFLATLMSSNWELSYLGIHSSDSSVNLILFHWWTFLLFRRFRTLKKEHSLLQK